MRAILDRTTIVGEDTKKRVKAYYDAQAKARNKWYRRNRYYHDYIEAIVSSIIPVGSRVLELGCGTGNLLSALHPARGLGLDLSPECIRIARENHPELEFAVGDAETFELQREHFDFVVASDLVGELDDIASMLESVRRSSNSDTRLVVTFHNPALELALRAAQRIGWAMRPARQNWAGRLTMTNLLELADFRIETSRHGLLVPIPIPWVAGIANRHLSGKRIVSYVDLVNVIVARPGPALPLEHLTVSVVIPCRNEVDNVEAAVERTPDMGTHTEILFVDGASTDGTRELIEEMIARYEGIKDIRLLLQVPDNERGGRSRMAHTPTMMLKLGKGDAVRKGFDAAQGDVLMILDADLTVPPEDLPRFFSPLASGKARFVNGTRLVYPMEDRAMKFVNYLGNWFFSVLFTWFLEQPIRDTLCGTKALRKRDYQVIKDGRSHFGDFDPFGDFDLLFGAARARMRIMEVPVRYRRRISGVSKVRVWKHGWLLAGMSLVAFRRFKLEKWLALLKRSGGDRTS